MLALRTQLTRVIGKQTLQLQQRALLSTSKRTLNSKQPSTDNDILKDLGNISLSDIKINKDISKGTQSRANSKKADTTRDNIFHFSSWKGAAALMGLAGATYYLARREKSRLEIEKIAESNRPVVGGEFSLIDQNGKAYTDKDLLGHFSIMYFGFAHWPDICPAELDKLDTWLNRLGQTRKEEIQPIFVTCDPMRDTPEALADYLKDFRPGIVGLTGSYDDIKEMCRKYKVFFSTPRDADLHSDYIVDHSTFFYLLDPEGKFIDALGDLYDETEGVARIEAHIAAYKPQAERERRLNSWYSFLLK